MYLLCHTQIHGLKRLIEPRHRLYWAIALALLLCCAIGNLLSTVMRFFEAPTHLETRETIMTRMKFPSVLLCPEVYYQDYKIERLLQNKKYPSGMSAHTIRPIIKQLAAFFSPDVPYNVDDLELIMQFLKYNDLEVKEAGLLLTSSCQETLLRCRYLKKDYDCSDLFHMEITMYGFCCTFNGISLKRDIHLGGDKTEKLRVWYSSEVGPHSSLLVAVNQSQHLDNVDLSYKWLAIQKYRRYVDDTPNGTALSPGTEVWSSFHRKYLRVTDDSQFMGDQLRGCRTHTKQLRFFTGYKYNKTNCLMECRMDHLLRECGCLIPLYYRPPGIPLCNARSLSCARIFSAEFDKNSCDCPLSCYSPYELIETNTYQTSSTVEPVDSFYYGLNLSGVTIVRVFLKSHQTSTAYRQPIYNFFDLFSQLGGVFNVFFGCSILSILELLQLAWYANQPRTAQNGTRRKKKFFSICCRRRVKGVRKRRVEKVTFLKKYNKVFYSS